MMITAKFRRYLPLALRQEIKHFWRTRLDRNNGICFYPATGPLTNATPIRLIQPIMPSRLYENKIINIARGAALLDKNIIEPNQYWSFWHRIHRPTTANGFAKGRNLVNGELIAQTGGGLCQLSSMIYHLALLAGLTVIERHPHSIDIYEEHQRFTPLGADASIVWGFKDLRLYNPHPFSVALKTRIENGTLIGEVHAAAELVTQQVAFVRTPLQQPYNKVVTIVNNLVLATDIYEHRPTA